MYQAYVSDDGILFPRHFDRYVGAEVFVASLEVLAGRPQKTKPKGMCIDLSGVTHATLDDSDRALGAFMQRKIQSYGMDLSRLQIVRIYNPENVAVNKMLLERDVRVAAPFFDLDAIVNVESLPEALKVLGLPADYRVEYPS